MEYPSGSVSCGLGESEPVFDEDDKLCATVDTLSGMTSASAVKKNTQKNSEKTKTACTQSSACLGNSVRGRFLAPEIRL